jgi:hypothetical protein
MRLAGVAFAASAWICFHTNIESVNLCGGGNKINPIHLLHYHIIRGLGRILFNAFSINPSTRCSEARRKEADGFILRRKCWDSIFFSRRDEKLGITDWYTPAASGDSGSLRMLCLCSQQPGFYCYSCTATRTHWVIAKKYSHPRIKLGHKVTKKQH